MHLIQYHEAEFYVLVTCKLISLISVFEVPFSRGCEIGAVYETKMLSDILLKCTCDMFIKSRLYAFEITCT